jgi:twitching motility protein PilT
LEDNWLIREIIIDAVSQGASDIHIKSGSIVKYRVNGTLQIGKHKPNRSEIEGLIGCMMKDPGAMSSLYDKQEKDLTYSLPLREGAVRFRVNIALVQGGVYVVMRHLKDVNPDPLLLGVPQKFIDLVESVPYGIFFVVGPTGSGKSTTLASLISHFAIKTGMNFVTIEDPIEYHLIEGEQSNISQREVGKDTLTFSNGIRAAMREDPDIILVGEVRDPETAESAIRAAKTGHIVFTTMHTSITTQIPSRITGIFPSGRERWIMSELMESMVAGMAQSLIKTKTGGRTLVTEVLDTTRRDVRALLQDGGKDKVRKMMMSGEIGWTMNSKLIEKFKEGVISEEDIKGNTNDIDELNMLLNN